MLVYLISLSNQESEQTTEKSILPEETYDFDSAMLNILITMMTDMTMTSITKTKNI